MCHISLKKTRSHNRASPKCTPEHDEYRIQLNFTCSNDSRPTRWPYVQGTSIARCMSKFSFLKCNFLQNLLAPHNAASWLQKRLFCHLGLKIESTHNLGNNQNQGENMELFIRSLKVSSSLRSCFEKPIHRAGERRVYSVQLP